MRTMPGAISLAMAARSSAGAVGFRERSKDSDLGQTLHLTQSVCGVGQSHYFEQGGLLGQGGVEEPGLVGSGGGHNVLDYIE